MNRRHLGLLLIIPVLLQALSFTVIYAGYLYNKSYISTALCENRAVAERHCEGKCLLKKELKAEEEKENSIPSAVKKGSEVTYLYTEFVNISFHSAPSNCFYISNSDIYIYSHLSGIFHPPRA